MIVSDAWLSKWNCAIDCLFSITVGTVARRCVLSVQAAQWQYRTLVTSAWSECVTIVDFSLMMNSECVKSVWLLTDCWHCSHSMWQGLCNSTLSTCLSVCLSVPSVDACMLRWVCCCGPSGQEISISSGGHRVPQQHSIQQQTRAV